MLELQHEMIAEEFRELLEQSHAVADRYMTLAAEAQDPELQARLQEVCRDKLRHIDLVQRLLEIVD